MVFAHDMPSPERPQVPQRGTAPSQPDPRDQELASERKARQEAERRLDLALAGRGDPAPGQRREAPRGPDPLPDPPDPVRDPQGFRAWSKQAQEQNAQSTRAAIDDGLTRAQAQARQERIWSEFRSEHPQYAHAEGLVAQAVRELVNETGGLPPDESILKEEVARRLDQKIEKMGLSKPKSDPKPNRDTARTAGIDPAAAGNPRPQPIKNENDPEDTSLGLIEQLDKIQEQAGLV